MSSADNGFRLEGDCKVSRGFSDKDRGALGKSGLSGDKL